MRFKISCDVAEVKKETNAAGSYILRDLEVVWIIANHSRLYLRGGGYCEVRSIGGVVITMHAIVLLFVQVETFQ